MLRQVWGCVAIILDSHSILCSLFGNVLLTPRNQCTEYPGCTPRNRSFPLSLPPFSFLLSWDCSPRKFLFQAFTFYFFMEIWISQVTIHLIHLSNKYILSIHYMETPGTTSTTLILKESNMSTYEICPVQYLNSKQFLKKCETIYFAFSHLLCEYRKKQTKPIIIIW